MRTFSEWARDEIAMDSTERSAAANFGIPDESAQRVYNHYLITYMPDGWWVQPFDQWLKSNFDDWADYQETIEG